MQPCGCPLSSDGQNSGLTPRRGKLPADSSGHLDCTSSAVPISAYGIGRRRRQRIPLFVSTTMRNPYLVLLALPSVLAAQSAHVDYHKADLIRTSGAFVLNSAVVPTFFQDSTRFYY